MNILVKYIKNSNRSRGVRITKMLLLVNVISLSTVFAQGSIRTVAPEVAEFVEDELPVLEDRYFGEKPPGLIPVEFAPDIVSPEGLFEGGMFSPDMKTFYFTRKNGKYKERTFFVIRYENNSWGNESETDIKYPSYSRDGNIIYRGNQYRERTDTGWSELKSMGPPFTDMHIMGISVSDKGTFFFDEWDGKDTVGAISYSRLINGKYEPRQKMGKEINTGTWIAHPNIAPDESYLIWDVKREDGYGKSDIYISFRAKDGSWLPAINMGDKINTAFDDSGAYVSPDGKYLFFSRGEWEVRSDGSTNWVGKSYWVDAQVIENLRPQENVENDSNFQISEDRYFGQNQPGSVPEVFAPGIVSINGRYEYAVSFSPDLDEMYFSGEKEDGIQCVYFSKLKDEKWTNPKKANFTNGRKRNEFEAFVNSSGDKIYFAAYDAMFSDESIWYVNRLENSWSEARKLDSPVNSDIVFYPNEAKNGDLFYTSISKVKMYYAPNKNGKFPKVHEVGIEYGIHGFISPSQDFILVDARKENDKTKDRDIHVCFRKKDGAWTNPINLGDAVNSSFNETCPSLTPDGKYLFFSRYNEEGGLSNIYWVSTEVINRVRPVAQENSDSDFSLLEGPYLGQRPPGLIPEAFAPGIVTTAHYEFGGVFTPDMNEFYLIRNGGKYEKPSFVVFEYKNNRWHESVISPWVGQPFVGPDGKTMHLGWRYMERTESGWSAIKDLGPQFEDIRIMRLSASSKGTYYFDEVGTDGDGSIRYSRLVDGIREEPKLASKEINSGTWLAHPFIAPDESYLIWDGRRDNGYGNSDLYISYRQQDGSWGAAINLGDKINTDAWEASASVTPDGKYLFFHRMVSPGNVDIFWVDAQIIETLKPQ